MKFNINTIKANKTTKRKIPETTETPVLKVRSLFFLHSIKYLLPSLNIKYNPIMLIEYDLCKIKMSQKKSQKNVTTDMESSFHLFVDKEKQTRHQEVGNSHKVYKLKTIMYTAF